MGGDGVLGAGGRGGLRAVTAGAVQRVVARARGRPNSAPLRPT